MMRIRQATERSQAEQKTERQYMRELFGSIAVYAALFLPSVLYGSAMDAGPFKTIILACPVLGFFLMIWAVARQVGRMDEYQRRVMLETFSIASAVTVGLTFTYGFLESAGYPRLSMFAVWGVMGSAWLVVALFRRWMMER